MEGLYEPILHEMGWGKLLWVLHGPRKAEGEVMGGLRLDQAGDAGRGQGVCKNVYNGGLWVWGTAGWSRRLLLVRVGSTHVGVGWGLSCMDVGGMFWVSFGGVSLGILQL